MGYCTDGRWVIKGPKETVAAAWAAARLEVAPFNPEENIAHHDASLEDFAVYTVGETGYIRFGFSQCKWYSSYPDVKFYERVWSYLEDFGGLSGKRVHIGEDGAVEDCAFGDDYVAVDTHVDFYDEEPQPPKEYHHAK